MNQGTPWYEVQKGSDIFGEIDKNVPELIKSIDAAGLFFAIPEDRCIEGFARALTKIELRSKKVKIIKDYDIHPPTDYFKIEDGLGVARAEIFKGLTPRPRCRKIFEPFCVEQLFLTKACYLLVSRSSPKIRCHFEGEILQMSDFYETMMLTAERFVPYLVRGLYPDLNTRIKTLMLSCAQSEIYSYVPVEVWLLIKSMVGWDLGRTCI